MKKCKYLRIRLTDKCNLKCKWCHKEGCVAPSKEELSPSQIENVVRFLSSIGFTKIKLAGGEPTVRNDLEEIVFGLKQIPGIDLSMISNGTLLTKRKIFDLYNAGLRRINISINTMRSEIFREHQFGNSIKLRTAIDSLKHIIDVGMDKPKVNFIYLGSQNEKDLIELIDFVKDKGIHIRLLNLLPGFSSNDNYPIISTAALIDKVISLGCNKVKLQVDESSFSDLEFLLENGAVAEIGHHLLGQEFVYKSCSNCGVRSQCLETVFSQRLTPDGFLQPCLLRTDNLFDLRPFINGEVDEIAFRVEVVEYLNTL